MERINNVTLRCVLAGSVVGAPMGVALAADEPVPEAQISARAEPILSEHKLRAETAQAKAEERWRRVEAYRRMGGVAYKSGLVQRMEAEAAKYAREAAEALALARGEGPAAIPVEAQEYLTLAEQYRRMGGAAYKNGLVAWAEAQARKHAGVVPEEPRRLARADERPSARGKPIEVWLDSVK